MYTFLKALQTHQVIFILLGVLLYSSQVAVFSQTPDVFRAEYMLMPKNSLNFETVRYKLTVNVPIPVRKKKDFLVLGAEYNRFDFALPTSILPNTAELENFHVVDVNLAYVYKWNDLWRFIGVITPRWSSNFTTGPQKEDFVVNVTAGALSQRKDIEKPYILVLGLSYNATSPVRVPLPVAYFEKRFHPHWAYILGVPKSGFKYITDKEHFFQTELFLDGYYVNVQNDILLSNNILSTDVSNTALLWTVGYQYKFTKEISVYLMGGYTLIQNGVLRDADRNNIFTLNNGPGLYFRTGFRIGI
jgi:hypothetical protein